MSIDLKALAAEFPKPAVHWRVQGKPYERNGTHSAMALAYIDARDVMDRLDEVCGPENWQTQYSETAAGRVLCSIGIRFGDEWIWKTDGAGNTAVEGEKGGISDALKRAAVSWGIGRYLYRLSSPWVECTVNPKNGAWKAWVGDPWAKVKVVGYQQPEAPKPDPELEWFKSALPGMTTPDQINAVLGRAKAAGTDASKLVMSRAKALGLTYSEAAGGFVAPADKEAA